MLLIQEASVVQKEWIALDIVGILLSMTGDCVAFSLFYLLLHEWLSRPIRE